MRIHCMYRNSTMYMHTVHTCIQMYVRTFVGTICCHLPSLCTPGLHKSIKQEDLQRHLVYLNEKVSQYLRDLSKEVIQLFSVVSTGGTVCILHRRTTTPHNMYV